MVENTKQTTVVHFIADGEVKEFHFNFQIFEAGDVDVYLDETLTDTGYNVSIDEEIGGKVIFNQPPVNGTRITIIRNLDIKRTSDFQEGGAFRAKVINHELDYQVATLQQLDEKIGRSMIYPPYVQDGVSMELPLPAAGKALVWNSDESGITNSTLKIDTVAQEVLQYRNEVVQRATEAEQNANITKQAAQESELSAEAALQSAQKAEDAAVKASFGNIGDIKYTTRTDVPNGGVWCDGKEYTQAMFPDVYQMLVDGKIETTDFSTFDESVSANGSCGLFALDSSTQKFKVPLLKDVYIKAGQTSLMFSPESLPDHKHIQGGSVSASEKSRYGIVNTNIPATHDYYQGGNFTHAFYTSNALEDSKVYQNNAKVNPDNVVYRAYVVLYTSAAEVSLVQATEFINSLRNKANVDLKNVSSNVDFIIESQINEDGSWYRIYKSGWLEQGGNANDKHDVTINLIKPFFNTNYMVEGERISGNIPLNITNKTTTSFYPTGNRGLGCWIAIGQGA